MSRPPHVTGSAGPSSRATARRTWPPTTWRASTQTETQTETRAETRTETRADARGYLSPVGLAPVRVPACAPFADVTGGSADPATYCSHGIVQSLMSPSLGVSARPE